MLDFVLARLPETRADLKAMAEHCHVSWQALEKLKRGETVNPRIGTLQPIYDYLKNRNNNAA